MSKLHPRIVQNNEYIDYCTDLYKDKIKDNYSLKNKVLFLNNMAYFLSLNITKYFSSPFLEKELNELSEKIEFDYHSEFIPDSTLHIMTRAYSTGGHTKLVEQWISNLDFKSNNSVVFIEHKSEHPPTLVDIINKNGNVFTLKRASLINKAKELAKLASKFEKVVLHIHPFEIVPNLAFGNRKFPRPIVFMNHADHSFSCGYSVSNMLLDLSSEGVDFSQNVRGIKNNHKLSIPVESINNSLTKEKAREHLCIDNNKKIILSIGTSYKYGVGKELKEFHGFAKELVKLKDNTEFLIIGPSSDEYEWNQLSLDSNGKIKPLGIVNRDKLKYYICACDLYIESFPFASYTAFLEVASYKVNLLRLKTEVFSLDSVQNSGCQCLTIDELLQKADLILNNPYSKSFIPDVSEHTKPGWKENYLQLIKSKLQLLEAPYHLLPLKELENEYANFIYRILGYKVPIGKSFKKLPLLIKIKLFFKLYTLKLVDKKKLRKTFFKTLLPY